MVIKFVRYIISLILVTFVIMAVTFFIVILVPKGVFRSNYNSLIQDKFRILKTTNKPKIIVVSGSSSAFGLDQQMLEKATGYKVANLGLAAGFGPVFYTELTKANINKASCIIQVELKDK